MPLFTILVGRYNASFKEEFSIVENFSYICAFQRGRRYTHIVFFRLIERKYLKGKSVPATKHFSARGLKIRKEVGDIIRLVILSGAQTAAALSRR